jgi:hypothetical protein
MTSSSIRRTIVALRASNRREMAFYRAQGRPKARSIIELAPDFSLNCKILNHLALSSGPVRPPSGEPGTSRAKTKNLANLVSTALETWPRLGRGLVPRPGPEAWSRGPVPRPGPEAWSRGLAPSACSFPPSYVLRHTQAFLQTRRGCILTSRGRPPLRRYRHP